MIDNTSNACPECGTFVSFLHNSRCSVYKNLAAAAKARHTALTA